jgi:UPF0716 protein FxsA
LIWLLIAFIAVPLVEIALFIQIGGAIGLWPTLLIVVLTAILGTVLVRQQGSLALRQLRERLDRLDDPTEELAHGAMILFSGALLLTPGFFTDAVGFALLIPAVRVAAFRAIRSRIRVQTMSTRGQRSGARHQDDGVIEGDYEEIDPEPRRHQGPSGWTKSDRRH